MALQFKITKSAYEALSDDMKKEYIAGDNDGDFVLDVRDLPKGEDVGPIKRALDSEKAKNKTLKASLDEANAKVEAAPDVEALNATHAAEVKKYRDFTEKTLLDGTATTLATKISTVPALLAKSIKERLSVNLDGDEPAIEILGPDGKVNKDMTIDKLSQEFVANKEYGAIMIGSKASGGGAPKPPAMPLGGGAPKVGEQSDKSEFDAAAASPQDMAARITARKAAAAAEAQQ